MMKPHELARAATLRSDLEAHGLAALEQPGPFGSTLGAVLLYRKLALEPAAHEPSLEQLAELICLYAAGIFRSDEKGIAAHTPEATRSRAAVAPG
ncbi:MAG: hypothetical protein OXS29_13460 [bacterium]|nr:hypothetical protein [bacterium]MDE0287552.1 hypothetical protein [bacterium]MDE0437689.1 hypothetical protein [bacterium]